ncbi:MAG: amidohydrolase family protein [Mariniphaga sp.]|nr:amidohydrolase family protein [Mariniphaga sp.]
MKRTKKIDVHHHIFPKNYVDALMNAGVKNTLGVDFPKWTPETSLKLMDKNGIKMAILSITAPGVYFPDIKFPLGFSEELSRMTNETIAEIKTKYPERFGGFATIPLLNPDASIEELNYALDKLHLEGVCLMTNYNGKYLGNELFEPFFKELNRKKAVVYIHPTDPGEQFNPGLDFPNALIEAPFDTSRTVANLMYSGTLDRYPDIKYILSHGGGTLPFLAWRVAMIEYAQKDKKPPVLRSLYDFLIKGKPEKGLQHLRKMYFDTALVSGEYALRPLQMFAPPEHIVYGSDFCVAKMAPVITKNLTKNGDFKDENLDNMEYKNCLRLFPSMEQHYFD